MSDFNKAARDAEIDAAILEVQRKYDMGEISDFTRSLLMYRIVCESAGVAPDIEPTTSDQEAGE